ncbi:hypothetical protein HRW08_14710 [Streptomyces lunaelactis]|nr:hypothetical protein [Streptomyces lunaelactis]
MLWDKCGGTVSDLIKCDVQPPVLDMAEREVCQCVTPALDQDGEVGVSLYVRLYVHVEEGFALGPDVIGVPEYEGLHEDPPYCGDL